MAGGGRASGGTDGTVSEREERESGERVKALSCGCRYSDAWRCAVDLRMKSVACSCRCHRYVTVPQERNVKEGSHAAV